MHTPCLRAWAVNSEQRLPGRRRPGEPYATAPFRSTASASISGSSVRGLPGPVQAIETTMHVPVKAARVRQVVISDPSLPRNARSPTGLRRAIWAG
jgi:hypothetical protein